MKMMHDLWRRASLNSLRMRDGADAGIHLDEVGPARRDERHAGFARHRPRQQRLARARRADQQDAARDPSADRREARRVLQEVDDLLHLVLGLVHAGDVLEHDSLNKYLLMTPKKKKKEKK